MRVATAGTDAEIRACYATMAELRPHVREDEFLGRVRKQMEDGYELAFVEDDQAGVTAVAGFRVSRNLAWGRFLYVDDLITRASTRSKGHGKALMDWLVAEARRRGCDELHLDSGVQRFAAHRFYLRERLEITSHHFALKL